MITRELIEGLFDKYCKEQDMFLVDIAVKNNVADVLVDTKQGITVSKCVEISRLFRKELDEISDVYELNVSSPGLGTPLKVLPQYEKNIGREVEVTLQDELSKPFKAVLMDATTEGIVLQITHLVKEGKRKRKEVYEKKYQLNQIKTIKVVVFFK